MLAKNKKIMIDYRQINGSEFKSIDSCQLQEKEEGNMELQQAGTEDTKECQQLFPVKKEKKVFSRIGASLITFLVISVVMQCIALIVVMVGLYLKNPQIDLLDITTMISGETYILISVLPMYLCGFPVLYLIMKGMPVASPEDHPWSFGKLFVVFVICVGVMYIGNFIGSGLMWATSLITNQKIENPLNELLMGADIRVIFLSVVVIAPIGEEVIFRKLLIDRIGKYGDKTAIIVSGILFGLIHGNFFQFFYACTLGMIFAYVYIRTGRLFYCIIYHMTINFIGSIISLSVADKPVLLGLFSLFIVAAMIAGAILLGTNWKHRVIKKGEVQIPFKSWFSTVFLNAGMGCFIIISIIGFVVSIVSG